MKKSGAKDAENTARAQPATPDLSSKHVAGLKHVKEPLEEDWRGD